jgi:hypothetical protein
METVTVSSDWRDDKWHADFAAALNELTTPTRKLLPFQPRREIYDEDNPYDVVPLPLPPLPLQPFSVPVVRHEPTTGRSDVLDRITVRKTAKPGLREVLFEGALVGKIAKNTYGLGWVASCSRSMLFWSIQEAALALVQDAGVLP